MILNHAVKVFHFSFVLDSSVSLGTVLLEMVLQVVGPPLLLLRSFLLLLQASFRIIRHLDVDCRTVRKYLKGFSESVLRPKAMKERLFVCATFRGMQPAEKDANFDELQAVVNDAFKKALGAAEHVLGQVGLDPTVWQ